MCWILCFGFISILIYPTFLAPNLTLMWSQDSQYDYIAGISARGRMVCPGIIVTMHTVLTSANPLQPYLRRTWMVRVHTVHEEYDKSLTRNIEEIFGDQANRRRVWVGFDYSQSSVHDIVLIKMSQPIRLVDQRGPKYAVLPFVDSIYNASIPESGWMVAGFGYTDKDHVKNNSILEVTRLPGSRVDCDEWIPREWGLFICISDDEGLHGVPSGGPLFHEDKQDIVIGIGCFHLKRGNDSILVFTRLKSYRFGLRGYYANDVEEETTSTSSTTSTSVTTSTPSYSYDWL